MPFRTKPPWRRIFWDKLAGSYFLGYVLLGFAAVPWPGHNVSERLELARWLYSAGCVGLGGFAFYHWWVGHRKAEAVAMYSLVALTLVHALIIVLAERHLGTLDAGRIGLAAVGLAGWAGIRYDYGMSHREIEQAIRTQGRKEAAKA